MNQVVIGVLSQKQQPKNTDYAYHRNTDYEYLVGRRSGKAYHGCWEFPGGKVETGESPAEALAREWVEELGQDIIVGAQFFIGRLTMTDLTEFQALAYRVTMPSFTIAQATTLTSHSELRWMSRTTILSLPDDECTPSLKPITQLLTPSPVELVRRAEACIAFVLATSTRRRSDKAVEEAALALMPEGKLEAARRTTPE